MSLMSTVSYDWLEWFEPHKRGDFKSELTNFRQTVEGFSYSQGSVNRIGLIQWCPLVPLGIATALFRAGASDFMTALDLEAELAVEDLKIRMSVVRLTR